MARAGHKLGWSAVALVLAAALAAGWGRVQAASADPAARALATCSDYDNQAAAQRAADTRDPDGDGVYCVISPR